MVTSKIHHYLLRAAFHLLYHPLAWTYDLVAAIASSGKWIDWIHTAVPYLSGPRILELGFGPGHLQEALISHHWMAFGIDESRQMAKMAKRRMSKNAQSTNKSDSDIHLMRGKAQFLPFAANTFDRVVSTFPTMYIFDPSTLSEIDRVLTLDGELIIVLGAEVTGRRLKEKFSAWLSRTTRQSVEWDDHLKVPFGQTSLKPEVIRCDLGSSKVLIVKAKRQSGVISKTK